MVMQSGFRSAKLFHDEPVRFRKFVCSAVENCFVVHGQNSYDMGASRWVWRRLDRYGKAILSYSRQQFSYVVCLQARMGEVGGNNLGFFGCLFSPDGRSILAHSFSGGLHMWRFSSVIYELLVVITTGFTLTLFYLVSSNFGRLLFVWHLGYGFIVLGEKILGYCCCLWRTFWASLWFDVGSSWIVPSVCKSGSDYALPCSLGRTRELGKMSVLLKSY